MNISLNPPYNVVTTSLPNVTTDPTSDPTADHYTVTESVFMGLFLGVVIFMAIVGNILVCLAVFTDRQLKQTSNFFIVSLAIADLLVAAVVMTFAVVNDITGKWVFGSTFCSIWLSSDVMCSTASILNLCAISLDRFIHIRDPLKYERVMTTRKTIGGIVFVWVCSTCISFLPIHLGWHEPPGHVQQNDTDEDYTCVLELSPVYAIVSSTISFYIPCIVMLALYTKLYLYARKHVKSINRMQTPAEYGTTGQKVPGYKVSDHKARITLGVIMGVFLFCWSPFFLVNIVYALCSTCVAPVVFVALTWLGYVNSALNPVIYSIFNQEFRNAFRRLLFLKSCTEYSNDYLRKQPKRRVNSRDSSNSTNAILNRSTENGKHMDIMYQQVPVAEKVTSL